jgi:HK97 family phage prohead protease
LNVSVKDVEQGLVEAVIATFNVKDHDGDWTLPGAFEDGAEVRISAYGHRSWFGELPVGKGTIRTTDQDARLIGQFFLDTEHGRQTFLTIKHLGALQEWSYGFDVVETGEVTEELRQLGVVRVLKRVKVHEVSPVLLGAGIATRTIAVKQRDSDDCALRHAALREWLKFARTAARLRGVRVQ